jgi:N-acetylglucosamine-6-sulfatase
MPMGERCGPSTNTEVATQKGSRVVKKKGEGKMQARSKRSGQVRLALMLIIGVAAAAACVAALMWWKAPVDPAQAATQPNIIFIITDDMRKDDLNPTYMPQTTKQLVEKGRSFQNAFVSNPLCCPSRATIMRGQYGHNTKIWFNTNIFDPDPNVHDGGWLGYNGNGYEKDNVATHLKAAGYRTGLFGKYLNGYVDATDNTPPLGWDRWFAFKTLHYYGYDVNDQGTIKHFGSKNSDYSTNVLNTQVQDFIRTNAAPGKPPIFAYVAPYAPHDPAKPGPGDQTTFNGIKAPRAPISFNEQDVTDKPPWIQSLRRLTSDDIANIDQRHENRIESLQAVDRLVAAVVSTLGQQGVLSNTYIVFTSDNGFHHGEHRIQQGKARPYEEDIRVPLVIRGPNVPPGSSIEELVLNADYFPTFMDLAGAQTPPYVDGRSLLPVLTGSATTSWRTAILIEGRKYSADPEIPVNLNYNGIRTSTSKYVEYEGGFRELYDLTPDADPNELTNTYYSADPTVPPRPALKARLDALKSCQPQDDPTTPEVEKPCQAAEDGP